MYTCIYMCTNMQMTTQYVPQSGYTTTMTVTTDTHVFTKLVSVHCTTMRESLEEIAFSRLLVVTPGVRASKPLCEILEAVQHFGVAAYIGAARGEEDMRQ